MIAIVAEGARGRNFLSATDEAECAARVPVPDESPDTDLPLQALGFRVQNYGMKKHRDLFTPRQLTALVTFTNLVAEARNIAIHDATAAGGATRVSPERALETATAYGDAVGLYLALTSSKLANRNSSLCTWMTSVECPGHVFKRSALSMTSDYCEANPVSGTSGHFESMLETTLAGLGSIWQGPTAPGRAEQAEAQSAAELVSDGVVSTDPPYYDNVPYADLSDFFYVWLRRAAKPFLGSSVSTVLVPKHSELVSDPFRYGSAELAERHFLNGMTTAIRGLLRAASVSFPTAIYYAFKQSEAEGDAAFSTGWETFLQSLVDAELTLDGTWPMTTERAARTRARESNALSTSIVLVCRKRGADAPTITRTEFRRELRTELPAALKALQHGNIAPVDMAQASIGPGMAIFSRHAKVLEADGSAMSVRTALQIINQALDEYLAEQEGEFDPDTRFAVTWFETRAFDPGAFGEAETLAKARNVSVQGVAEAGILQAGAGKVRLIKRSELPSAWDPKDDARVSVWEATQHLIKRMDEEGESAAGALLARLGSIAAAVRDLAYRLYQVCERKGWAEEARAYNGLVIAWPELEKLASNVKPTAKPTRRQQDLL
jgi:putative DNA methylase